MAAAGPRPGTAARLPHPRGPLSAGVLAALRRPPGQASPARRRPAPEPGDRPDDWRRQVGEVASPLTDDDLHLALYCMYELHYRGFEGVDPEWEWDPWLLAHRAVLESAFLAALLDAVGPPQAVLPSTVEESLHGVLDGGDGPSLSGFVEARATLDQVREMAVHRSAYQLKEADPHTWAIPRLDGAPKAALVHVQADEYGGGRTASMHSELFRSTMRALDLDDGYGAHLDLLPGVTLATVNLVSLFGLHRRWRGALAGHLAIFEMASVVPMGRYAAALRRLGLPPEAATFYDVHVEADATHEIVASRQLAAALAAAEPDLAGDVLFGARALMLVEDLFTRHLLDSWDAGRSSLRRPAPIASPVDRAGGLRQPTIDSQADVIPLVTSKLEAAG